MSLESIEAIAKSTVAGTNAGVINFANLQVLATLEVAKAILTLAAALSAKSFV